MLKKLFRKKLPSVHKKATLCDQRIANSKLMKGFLLACHDNSIDAIAPAVNEMVGLHFAS